MRGVGKLVALLSLLLAGSVGATTRALVVAGLGGEPDYEMQFQRQAKSAADALRQVTNDVVLLLGEIASRERLRDEFDELVARSAADDVVVLMLIGHGSYDERDYRFNVPGPDVLGSELNTWLDGLPAASQLVVAATSASGALQPVLEAPQRTVVTATRSGGENNASVFAGYFTDAFAATSADTDKDGYVSAVEAFRFAESGTARHFDERQQMATEHPTLAGPEADVVLARLPETPTFNPAPADDGRLAAVEAEIDALRRDKDAMTADAYYAELQRLLLQMALLRRELAPEDAP